MTTFGARLKKERESRDLSQQELANRLNLSQSSIAYYEKDKKQPPQNTLAKIADFFEVSVDYLLGRTDARDKQPVKSEGRAYYGGGDDWTDEERQLAQAAVEDWRRRKKEMEKKLEQKENN